MAAQIIAAAAIKGKKFAASFPVFTAERRGAPVTAFVRIDDSPIREKTQIYHPDGLIIIDANQDEQIFQGLKSNAAAVFNVPEALADPPHEAVRITGTVNATQIALDELGIPAFNTCMIGAFSAVTGWIEIGDVLSCLDLYFKGAALEKNRRCVERGYQEVKKIIWESAQTGKDKIGRAQKPFRPVSSESPWTRPGRLRDMKVGDWRYQRPVKNDAQCCGCGWCFLLCPTGCVVNDHGDFKPNLDYCKGCGICAEECPIKAITMVREGI